MADKNHAETLFRIIPAVYRNRDSRQYGGSGDLKKYFSGNAVLLNQLHATLEQFLADHFPDNPNAGAPACQDWLLPYFADLFDVRLVSPLTKGRRDEIARAIRWRQGKGTLRVVEEIAESVAQLEVMLQEGWKRVAVTPRLNVPLMPEIHYGLSGAVPLAPPSVAARHPGLPAVTPDFRCPSGAVKSNTSNPAAQQSSIDGDTRTWRQVSFHGAPCYPNSFEDVSRRTVDFRSGDWRSGHFHPDRILLYTVPPAGFFPDRIQTVNWSQEPSEAFLRLINVITENNTTVYRNKTFGKDNFVPVNIRRTIQLGQVEDGVGDPDFHTWRFEGVNLLNTLELDSGRVELVKCAARKVEVHSIDKVSAVITAQDCLFRQIQAARGRVKLAYCTVLESTLSEYLLASDCIFLGLIHRHHLPDLSPPEQHCLRYSRIARNQDAGNMRLIHTTRDLPVMLSKRFGDRSSGVLHPATPRTITRGAEDGTEMGAYHSEYLSFLADAVVEKLRDYLPLDKQALVIPDSRLLAIPE
ncbi:phage tail protein [Nitrosomonas marina]|uniref:Phage tail protein (Tail_P2_I) n=1 Tax=Nitrosomonas marina TaxID=917 RepID=A0A1H8ALS1_9PROT|nr:hypothetical protein [Nitrosomonas marina]SEM71456.1 Phage tail protein (Tail_P2_I) [Nitrosomonas marina]